jgi:putative MATE family efflux protein
VSGRRGTRGARQRVRLLLALALPAVAALIADPLMGVVDTAVVGRIGAAELGGLGLGVAILTSLSWVFNFLVIGTTSTVARAVGRGERDTGARHVATAVRVALVAGVVIGALLLVLAPTLVRALGSVEELVEPATTYLRMRALGVPLLLLTFVGHGAFRGASDTRTPMAIAIGANVVNAVLTFALVGPFGIAGVAAATVIAELIAVVAFALRMTKVGLAPWRARDHGVTPPAGEVRALLVVGRDLFLRTGALLLGYLAISAAAARMGIVIAAAHQVMLQVLLLSAFALDAIAIAAQATIGTAIGRGDRDEAVALGRTATVLGAVAGVLLTVVLLAASALLPRVMTDDVDVLAVVASAWWILAAIQTLNGIVFALDGVLMGAEDYAYLRTSMILAAVAAASAAQAVASMDGTLVGLWGAVALMMVLRGVALLVRLAGSRWAGPQSAARTHGGAGASMRASGEAT